MCRAVSAKHVLHRWRLSGKNGKKLLSEEAILGDFFYIIRNKFGLSDWFHAVIIQSGIALHALHIWWYSNQNSFCRAGHSFIYTENSLSLWLRDSERCRRFQIHCLGFRLTSRYNFTSSGMQLYQLLS